MKKIICSICKEKKSIDEMIGDICQDCAASIVQEDDLDIGMDNFS
jgi:hypothetical protein